MIHLTDHLLRHNRAMLSVTSIQHHPCWEVGMMNGRIASLRMFRKIREPDWHFVRRHAMQRSVLRSGAIRLGLIGVEASVPADTSTS